MTVQGTVGLLGCGNMGSAIVRGLVEAGTVPPAQVVVYDVDDQKAAALEALGCRIASSPEDLMRDSDILLLATKPQDLEPALAAIKPQFTADALLISIAAGISTDFIREHVSPEARVIRVMPNTPALVGACASGIAASENCTETDVQTALRIFESIGLAVKVAEADIDAVTALSGSGPAYFFYTVECLVKAATGLGLSDANANLLAGQTLYGAGKLLMESGESAATLRERVTSKGGTTAAALEQFQSLNLEDIVRAGVEAAAARSKELGK